MMAIALLYLAICLQTQLISVESLQVPCALHSTITSTSPSASSKSSTQIYLKEAEGDPGSEGLESSSLVTDEEIDFDWKAIAEYVFDESVDFTEPSKIYGVQDETQGSDDDQSMKNEMPHHHSKPIILFDGICNLCNGGVNFAIDNDKTGKFRFASLQSNVAKSLLLRDGKDPCTTSDIVLVMPDKTYYSSEAVARIMAGLDLPALKILGILGQITPSFARNMVYRVVSGNRFIFGENDSCRMDFDGAYTSSFVSDPPESIGLIMNEDKEEK